MPGCTMDTIDFAPLAWMNGNDSGHAYVLNACASVESMITMNRFLAVHL